MNDLSLFFKKLIFFNYLLAEGGVPILHKAVDAGVGEGMGEHLSDDFVGYGGDVGACLCGVDDTLGRANACRDYLALDIVNCEDLGDVGDKVDAV
jgi:hypothetical protein